MLYLVPTPVGNLEDITLRALDVLRSAQYILAEDTRTTRKLLSRYEITTRLRVYHAHNEHVLTPQIIADLSAGMDIAMVTDAGTPGISDPGYLLVNACQQADLPYSCLPGATAFVPALVMSGLPSHTFTFAGFLPQKKGRKNAWEKLRALPATLVLYESPHRLLRCLSEVITHFGAEHEIAVVREISKIHEEVRRGSTESVLTYYRDHPEKCVGEIVVIIAGKGSD